MRELAVMRALEPDQDEVLAHLLNVGAGHAMSVLGDLIGSRLVTRGTRVHFESLSEESDATGERIESMVAATTTTLHGALTADAGVLVSAAAVDHFQSRLGPARAFRARSDVHARVTAQEIGNVVLASTLEGLRPLLTEPFWFAHPQPVNEVASWLHGLGRTAVGALVGTIAIVDGDSSLDFELILGLGPHSLDGLLVRVENLAQEMRG